MTTKVEDIFTRVAYRNDQESSPGDTEELNKWYAALNEGYFHILRQRKWWFLESKVGYTYLSGKNRYRQPINFNGVKQVWINSQIATPIRLIEIINGTDDTGELTYDSGNKWLTTKASSSLALPSLINNISGTPQLTSNETIATGVTVAPHGLNEGDWVQISGAAQSEYNGTFQVWINSTTSFSYEMDDTEASQATLASGVMAISISPLFMLEEYYQMPTTLLATPEDTVLIPDAYVSMLDAYVYHKIAKLDTQRATAADALAEYNDTLLSMHKEDFDRTFLNKHTRG